jgi:hypothetical protein
MGEVREPIAARTGQLQRYDSEYQRNGTANLFVFIDPHRRWRHVKVTERRTSIDFAKCMRDLVDVHYPDAELVRVVLDNLSTHTAGALYEAFEPEEARRILRRVEFHYVPKHGSWLNMAEIEIGVLRGQCLDRRLEDAHVLSAEIAAWEAQRNDAKATIEWTFTTEKAREKMGRSYPNKKPPEPTVVSPEPATADHPQNGRPPRAKVQKRKRPSTGPAARFKARPTLPRRRPERRKPKASSTKGPEPVRTSVRSY